MREAIQAAAAHYAFVSVAQVLGDAGIECMPIKGVYLMATIRKDNPRLLSDIDVVVRRRDYARGCEVLRNAGFADLAGTRDGLASTWRGPDTPMVVDFHGRLFLKGLYRITAEEVFARGHPDAALYGVRVILPSWLDVLAITVANAAKDRRALGDPMVVSDLSALGRMEPRLDPQVAADHLVRCGLGRAARLVLKHTGDADFAPAVLSSLPADAVGDGVVVLAVEVLERVGNSSLSFVVPHLLNRDLREATLSGFRHLALGARFRWNRLRRGDSRQFDDRNNH